MAAANEPAEAFAGPLTAPAKDALGPATVNRITNTRPVAHVGSQR